MPDDDESDSGIRNHPKTLVSESCRQAEDVALESPTEKMRAYLRSGKGRATDNLDVYNSDFRTFSPLGDVETADMRHQRQLRSGPRPSEAGPESCTENAPEIPATWIPAANDGLTGNLHFDRSGQFETGSVVQIIGERCGHRYAGISACRRCLDACAHQAIDFGNPMPQIDHQSCRGCGTCVTACPSGALQLTRPMVKNALNRVSAQTANCLWAPLVNFYETGSKSTPADESSSGRVDIRFEPNGALGIETILATLAIGAAGIAVLPGVGTSGRTMQLLDEQVQWTQLIIAALGYPKNAIVLLKPGADTLQLPVPLPGNPLMPPAPVDADFAQPKRGLARWAIEQLAARNQIEKQTVALPAGAPYGEVVLDQKTCTLCMACTSICPTGALTTAGESDPGLRFKESDCIQCGLCVAGCPENSLQLNPRMHFDAHLNAAIKCLKEEVPFLCVRCGAAFTTQTMVETMTARLSGHWMFESDAEKRRLQMCRTCRIRDIFENSKESEPI